MKFNKNRALSLEDLVPIVGEVTILNRRKYESNSDGHDLIREFAVIGVSFYQALTTLTILSNYEVFF